MSCLNPPTNKEILSATTEASTSGITTTSNDSNNNTTTTTIVSSTDISSSTSSPSTTASSTSTPLVAPKLKATAKEFVPNFKIPSMTPPETTSTPQVVPSQQQQQPQIPSTGMYPGGAMSYSQMPYVPGQVPNNPLYNPQAPPLVMYQLPTGQIVYSTPSPQYQQQGGMPFYPGGHNPYMPVPSTQQSQQQQVMNMVPYPMTGQVPLQQQSVRVGGIPSPQGQPLPYVKNKQPSPPLQNQQQPQQQQQPRGQYNPNTNINNNNTNTRYNNPYTAVATGASGASGGGLSATAPDFTVGVGAGSRSGSIVDPTTSTPPLPAAAASTSSIVETIPEKNSNGAIATTATTSDASSNVNSNNMNTHMNGHASTAVNTTPAVVPVVESDSWETSINTLNFNNASTAIVAATGGVADTSFSFTADEATHDFQFTGHEDDSVTTSSASTGTSVTAATSAPAAVVSTQPPIFIVDSTTTKNNKSRAQSITVDTRFETDQGSDSTQPVPPVVTEAAVTEIKSDLKQETDKTPSIVPATTTATTTDKKSSRNPSPTKQQQQHTNGKANSHSLIAVDAEPSPLANTNTAGNNFSSNNNSNNNNKQRNDNRSGNNGNHNNNNNNNKDWNRTTSPKPEPSPNSQNSSGGSGAAVSASATPTAGSSTPAGGASSGWRRAETATLPLTVTAMLALKDSIIRYDKMTLIRQNKRNKLAPKEIVAIYPFHSQKERFPFLPKGMKDPELYVDESTQEEFQALFKGKENAFKFDPSRLANTEDPEVVMRKANLILNKLSVTNFDKLSDEFMAVGIRENDDMLNRAVDLLVLKAQMEEHFCFMYADLCRKIIDVWADEGNVADAKSAQPTTGDGDEENDTVKDTATAATTTNNTIEVGKVKTLGQYFREKLLERCREEFQINRKEGLQKIYDMVDTPEDIKLEKEVILKKRYNGHMRFIGEIYMKDLVKPKIMKECFDTLLEYRDEESLVCLTKLLRTIGQKLEIYDNSKKSSKFIVRSTMEKIQNLCNPSSASSSSSASSASASNKNKNTTNINNDINDTTTTTTATPLEPVVLSSRIRFMLKDLLDMWRDGWKARIEETKAKKIGPSASTNDLDSSGGNNNVGGAGNSNMNLNAMSSKSTSGSGGRNDARAVAGGQGSPKFQDARSMSGRSGTVTVTAPVVVTPPPVVDEWSTVSTGKKKNNATATTTATSGGSGMSKSTSSSDISSSRSGASVGGMFSALQNKKKSTSGTSTKDQSSSVSTKSSSRTVTMSGSDSKLSNKHLSSSSLSTSSSSSSSTSKNSNNNNNNNNSVSNGKNSNNNTGANSNNNSRLNTPSPSLPTKNDTSTTATTSAGGYDITDDSEIQNEEVFEEVAAVDYSQPVKKEILNAMRNLVEEYTSSRDMSMLDEIMNDMYTKAPFQRMGEVIKYLIEKSSEKKQISDRLKFIDFLIILCSPYTPTTTGTTNGNNDSDKNTATATATTRPPVISLLELNRGLLLFLNDLDQIAVDVPKAPTYFANIIASLLINLEYSDNTSNTSSNSNNSSNNSNAKKESFNLSFLKNVPEENNFSMSMNAHEFLGEIFSYIVEKLKNDDEAGTADSEKGLVKSITTNDSESDAIMMKASNIFIKEGGIELVQSLPHDPHSPETLTEVMSRVADKFNLPFLKLTI